MCGTAQIRNDRNTAHHATAALGARTASSIATGTAHTQWWDQLIGEISRPVTAQASAPSASSPRCERCGRDPQPGREHDDRRDRPQRLGIVDVRDPRDHPGQRLVVGDVGLADLVGVRRPCAARTSRMRGGARRIRRAMVPAALSAETSASRRRPASRNHRMKTPGVSLMPVASPMPRPRGHLLLGSPGEVEQDQRDERQVDLAVAQRGPHRLEPQPEPGDRGEQRPPLGEGGRSIQPPIELRRQVHDQSPAARCWRRSPAPSARRPGSS